MGIDLKDMDGIGQNRNKKTNKTKNMREDRKNK